jgi:hypothetical protein
MLECRSLARATYMHAKLSVLYALVQKLFLEIVSFFPLTLSLSHSLFPPLFFRAANY